MDYKLRIETIDNLLRKCGVTDFRRYETGQGFYSFDNYPYLPNGFLLEGDRVTVCIHEKGNISSREVKTELIYNVINYDDFTVKLIKEENINE